MVTYVSRRLFFCVCVLILKVQCDVGQFICPMYKNTTNARICVNQKHQCDGQYDCLKGEDEYEENCPKVSTFWTFRPVDIISIFNSLAEINGKGFCIIIFCRRKNVRKIPNVNNYVWQRMMVKTLVLAVMDLYCMKINTSENPLQFTTICMFKKKKCLEINFPLSLSLSNSLLVARI